MSHPSEQTIQCPGCGREQSFVVWDSINVTLDPDLKTKLINGELTQFRCEACRHESPVSYKLLYHDMEKRLMIWLIPDSSDTDLGKQDAKLMKSMTAQYQCRVVRTQNDLIEKILIFDAGLDDRVITVFKALAIEGLAAEREGDLSELYFAEVSQDDLGQKTIALEGVKDGERYEAPFLEYERIASAFSSKWPPMSACCGRWLQVNQDGVSEFA